MACKLRIRGELFDNHISHSNTYSHGRVHSLYVALLDQDLSRLGTEGLDLSLLDQLLKQLQKARVSFHVELNRNI